MPEAFSEGTQHVNQPAQSIKHLQGCKQMRENIDTCKTLTSWYWMKPSNSFHPASTMRQCTITATCIVLLYHIVTRHDEEQKHICIVGKGLGAELSS